MLSRAVTCRAALVMMIATALPGCPDTSPSRGRCSGVLEGRSVDLEMDADASHFFRDDDILLDDDAPFAMSYGGGTLSIRGELADLPSEAALGTHSTSSALFHSFSVEQPSTIFPTTGSMTLTTARTDRMGGTLDLAFDDGSSLACTFDLRRAYELDTDD